MNYKVAKTMLGLCIGYLAVFYVLKFFFPQLLIQTISSPTLIRLGEFINSWVGFGYIFRSISCFITLYLFVCASKADIVKGKMDLIFITVAVVILNLSNIFLPSLDVHTSTCCMLALSLICKGKFKNTVITFVIHGYSSQLLFAIKGFDSCIIYLTALSSLLLSAEGYVWLIALASYFYLKEKTENECMASALSQQEQEVS